MVLRLHLGERCRDDLPNELVDKPRRHVSKCIDGWVDHHFINGSMQRTRPSTRHGTEMLAHFHQAQCMELVLLQSHGDRELLACRFVSIMRVPRDAPALSAAVRCRSSGGDEQRQRNSGNDDANPHCSQKLVRFCSSKRVWAQLNAFHLN